MQPANRIQPKWRATAPTIREKTSSESFVELPRYQIAVRVTKKMHEVPTFFPTLAQCRILNSRQLNDFLFALLPTGFFLMFVGAGKSEELKDLQNQTSCVPNFHR